MDVSEKEYNLEDTQEAESKVVDDLVRESENNENSESVEEILDGDHEYSEKLEVGLDTVSGTEPSDDFTKPVESLSEEFTEATENPVEIEQSFDESNGVPAVVIDSLSNGIDSFSGQNGFSCQNGFSDSTPDQVSKGVERALDENEEVSPAAADVLSKETTVPDSGAVDLVSNQIVTDIPKSEDIRGVEDSDVPEVHHSTDNQTYIAVTPRLLQRTSWRNCCGLFQILRRSDQ